MQGASPNLRKALELEAACMLLGKFTAIAAAHAALCTAYTLHNQGIITITT